MNNALTIVAYTTLAAGALAAFAMMFRLGRAGGGKAGPTLLWLHRIFGYGFAAGTVFLFAGMLGKLAAYGDGLSPRLAWHVAVGFAVAVFLLFKWAVVRPFRGLMKFAPALGFTVFGLAFIVVNLGATAKVLTRGNAPVRIPPPAEKVSPLGGTTTGIADRRALPAARFVFAEKCGYCHHLRRPFGKPRPATEWPRLIERMRGYKRGWINDNDAATIAFYLSNDYSPGS